ncbi:uncharacterized protein C9orf85 homolog [Strongylocentrotus purpuratus]|uniref:Uncharacterized protein n=1 Tax=Strongylocentrotus purpuratus TaxID=7668 RepID=A0A7M7RDC4_STRPU|nr:uncharacterized protein C9orf85 homolog [Strongylocentrotus purpuratus]|eukprot:XP_783750.2 PREDICTED: uncharacterized protein C9orf85 homolog [Strongylocentrotus purpuratus]
MSSQRGNAKKNKPPKHVNKMGFKNSMHDTSQRTKDLNEMIISGVCQRCKDILAWKIKYKKYKASTQARKCTKCQQKRVKDSYHIICKVCCEAEGVCGKCGQKVEQGEGDGNNEDNGEEIRQKLAFLSERERRTYLRAQDKKASKERSSTSKHKECDEESDEDKDEESADDQCEENDGVGNGQVHVNWAPTA